MSTRSQISSMFVVVILALLLLAPDARAASEAVNCSAEPTDMALNSGAVMVGANCVLDPAMDNDFFRFSGGTGHVYRLAIANISGPSPMVLQVFDPDSMLVTSSGAASIVSGT